MDDPDAWFVYEDWRSPADFEAHVETPHVKAFIKDLPELCTEDIESCVYERVSYQAEIRDFEKKGI